MRYKPKKLKQPKVKPPRVRRGITADALESRLSRGRDLLGVAREDDLVRRADDVDHAVRYGQVEVRQVEAAEQQSHARLTAAAKARLGGKFVWAYVQGSEARLDAQMDSSGEVRALRVAAAGRWALYVGIPLLVAFGAWSTAGVHEGVVILLGLAPWSATWWAVWLVEPTIITLVAGLIVFAAILRRNGGRPDWRIKMSEISGLSTSVLLNAVGPISVATGFWSCLAALIPHSIGPVGAAATAWLLGVCDEHIARARPWDGAPSLAEMDLVIPDLDRVANPFRVQATRADEPPALPAGRPGNEDQDREDRAAPAGLAESPQVPPVDPDRPIDLVPVDPPPAAPESEVVVVPDEIPADWLTEYGTQPDVDQDDDRTGSSGAVATLDRPAGPTPAELAADAAAFAAAFEEAEVPRGLVEARMAAYVAAQRALTAGQTRIEAARAYIAVIESAGYTWSPTEVARAAGMASRAQIYRLPRRPENGDDDQA
jgi:hypothetical protein